MRNLVWSGTAMVFLLGAGLFVAAQHAARYPHSFVGRCAMTIYHMWDPLLAPTGDDQLRAAIAPTGNPEAPPRAKATPAAEPVEPIVVEPTEQEPPLALPRLSPEIAAAIERLRGEEESEAPPQAFDNPVQTLRMPYADEETSLPTTALTSALANMLDMPGTCGFFFLPPSWWQTLFDNLSPPK